MIALLLFPMVCSACIWIFIPILYGEIKTLPCNYMGPTADSVIHGSRDFYLKRIRRDSGIVHLLFNVHMDRSFIQLQNHNHIMNFVIGPAVNYFEKLLQLLHSPSSPIKLTRYCSIFAIHSTFRRNTSCDEFKKCTFCGPVEIPLAHLNNYKVFSASPSAEKVNESLNSANFFLYLAAKSAKECDSSDVLGFSGHCQLEVETDRPIAGFINFCQTNPNVLNDPSQIDYFVRHEVLHILGFSPSLYAYFRDKDGVPLTPREPATGLPALGWNKSKKGIYQWSDRVIKATIRNRTSALGTFPKTVHTVVTPAVLRVAREYFGCSDLDGVDLEDQGGPGVSLSHWEMRILGNELMTATYTNVVRLSKLTLAFLEDTGWYIANYSMADELSWGENRGCAFAKESCYSYMLDQLSRNKGVSPFCLTPKTRETKDLYSCTPDKRSFGFCNLVQHRPRVLSGTNRSMYTYFGDQSFFRYQGKYLSPWYFGKVPLTDYCPFIQEVTWLDTDGRYSRTSVCGDERNSVVLTSSNNYNLEVYGPDSICLPISTNWTLVDKKSVVYETSNRGAGCFKYRCSPEDGGLVVELAGGLQVLCRAGAPTTLVNVTVCLRKPELTVLGQFHCPQCTSLCPSEVCLLNRNNQTEPPPFLESRLSPSQSSVLLQPCSANTLNYALSTLLLLIITLTQLGGNI